ncbi:MAG: tetratricopeptide repeat protein [Candidatus Curtissbacteria bacterium]
MAQTQKGDWQNITDFEVLAQLAAQAALSSNWPEAAKINEKILKVNKDNVEALNRLARALVCMGELGKAQKLYKKALEIDPYNVISRKNYEKISASDGSPQKTNGVRTAIHTVNVSNLFVSEPGKTKVIALINLAAPNVLAMLSFGEELNIKPKNHSVTITTKEDAYLGALPDDLAHKLIAFITGGNQYEAYIKSVAPKSLVIFIREVYRSARFTNQPSFQATQISYYDSEE